MDKEKEAEVIVYFLLELKNVCRVVKRGKMKGKVNYYIQNARKFERCIATQSSCRAPIYKK